MWIYALFLGHLKKTLRFLFVIFLHCRVLHYSEYKHDSFLQCLERKFCCFPCDAAIKILLALDHLLQFESLTQYTY
jgi:hypothetical protein